MKEELIAALMKDIDTLLRVHRNPNWREDVLERMRERIMALPEPLPKEPPPELLRSMAMRYRHDFGLDHNDDSPMSSGCTPEDREHILRLMRQLYEEVAGYGFYRP